ncbi:MAG: YraN family protein [Clostridia bacterium]|nr:YraN family protein [Clostridia bacterium]
MKKVFNKKYGSMGEIEVLNYLKKKKYKLLSQNYKTKVGEVDVICQYKDVIIFVEVKFRETLEFGHPSEAVNPHKQAKIRRVAEEFLIRNQMTGLPVRFDVVEVLGNEINHIENCF